MKRTSLDTVTWAPFRSLVPGARTYRASTGALALVSSDGMAHISVSHPKRYPTWDELASARDHFFPGVRMVMDFPPPEEYINVHETCLHLWEADQ